MIRGLQTKLVHERIKRRFAKLCSFNEITNALRIRYFNLIGKIKEFLLFVFR
jgi:hypothetical protein